MHLPSKLFPKYEIDGGPANVAVYDVFKMKEHNFELKFDGVTLGTSLWKFRKLPAVLNLSANDHTVFLMSKCFQIMA
ncbi:MAG: hypothetical protein IPP29_22555 [Bacteroidetes bacterium]|nr:hypothetical protein [Bacteroidota bacterium]